MTNEQVIQAFNELLPYLETIEVRSEAIFELMQKHGVASEQDLAGAIEGIRAKKRGKWQQLRTKLESVLKEREDI
jgi:hypothetical protein